VALLALKGPLANAILIALWAGALGGMVFKLVWIDAPKWVLAAVYVALGLVTAAVVGELPAAIGWLGVIGLAGGGILYTIGAVVYASGKPNPWPKVFGYHEVFHALVLAAVALHYAVIAFVVVPGG
jgi:hemolysin III